MAFEIKPASRVGVIPLIMLYSESGCGKTYSALALARGVAGPQGVMILADSEERRGSMYSDIPEFGGYSVIDFSAPFSPATYREVLQAMYDARPAVGIVDSLSHEWEGPQGVLDMAAENEEKSGRAGLHNWKKPKLEHALMVQMLLRSPMPMICCIRAKYKTRQAKENGKTVIVKDDKTSPIQAEDLIFEATAHAELLPDHSIILTKCSHPELRKCFPEDRKGPLTIDHGRKIAAWCAAGGAAPKQDDTKPAMAILWKLLKPVRGTESNWTVAQQWLWYEMCMDPSVTVQSATVIQLESSTKAAQKKLA